MPPPQTTLTCLIIGSGIAGLSLALSLPSHITPLIYESRDQPSTIGGAVNLTPSALRLLTHLGVITDDNINELGCRVDAIEIFSYHTGLKFGELDFRAGGRKEDREGFAMRVERTVLAERLLQALAEKWKKRRTGEGEKEGGGWCEVRYGKKVVGVREVVVNEEDEEGKEKEKVKVLVDFDDGTSSPHADFVVGCDGMYSAVRMSYVQPSCKPIYTGCCAAYAIIEKSSISCSSTSSSPHSPSATKKDIPPHFHQTAMNSGRYGAVLTSFTDAQKSRLYLGAVMECTEQESREGWKVRGEDHEATMKELRRRYGGCKIPGLMGWFEKVEQFIFYPVCRLEPNGAWMRGRVVLIGDAAHGMPPQGESTGLAIEDAVLLGRVVSQFSPSSSSSPSDLDTPAAFSAYIKTRTPRINLAYEEAVARWQGTKDKSWLWNKLEENLIGWWMWFKKDALERSFYYDVREEEIVS